MRRPAMLAPVFGLVACQWSAEPSAGLDSIIRVEGGQAKAGSIATPAVSSPATASLFPKNATIFAGVSNKSIKGIVGPNANAVAFGIAGDVAYWLVPALSPDPSNPDSYTYVAGLSVSPAVTGSVATSSPPLPPGEEAPLPVPAPPEAPSSVNVAEVTPVGTVHVCVPPV